jgi:hypothetical protein
MRTARLNIALLGALMAFTAGCGSSTVPDAPASDAATPTPDILAEVFVAVPRPDTVAPIPKIRKQVAPGDDIVLEAKVMGVMHPFVENRALFVVGDESIITSCDLISDDDHCKTPWDACCEDPGNLRAGTATIQVIDENGQVLRHGLRGMNGLAELSRVRIAGSIAEGSNGDVMIINARAIEVL